MRPAIVATAKKLRQEVQADIQDKQPTDSSMASSTGQIPLDGKLDYRKLARQGARLEAWLSAAQLPRLVSLIEGLTGKVHARVRFAANDEHEIMLHITASAAVQLICQNCLDSLDTQLDCRFSGKVVDSSEEYSALGQGEDAVLSEGTHLCVTEVIEDELILALPMVPRHDEGVCASLAENAYSLGKAYNGNLEGKTDTAESSSVSVESGSSKRLDAGTYRPFAGLSNKIDNSS